MARATGQGVSKTRVKIRSGQLTKEVSFDFGRPLYKGKNNVFNKNDDAQNPSAELKNDIHFSSTLGQRKPLVKPSNKDRALEPILIKNANILNGEGREGKSLRPSETDKCNWESM